MEKNMTCKDCGKEISPDAMRCEPCWHASRTRCAYTCRDCGVEIDYSAMRCRPCYDKSRTTQSRVCPDCNGPKGPQAVRCRKCHQPYHNEVLRGRKLPEETKQKMSEAAIAYWGNIDKKCGKDRHYYDYRVWLKRVLEHDNYTCQHCESKDNLRVHHMESYENNPELRVEMSNGITLCKFCHDNFHHLLGLKSTRAQIFWFLKNVQLGRV